MWQAKQSYRTLQIAGFRNPDGGLKFEARFSAVVHKSVHVDLKSIFISSQSPIQWVDKFIFGGGESDAREGHEGDKKMSLRPCLVCDHSKLVVLSSYRQSGLDPHETLSVCLVCVVVDVQLETSSGEVSFVVSVLYGGCVHIA